MNVVLWVFQGVLALLYLAGGSYKVFGSDQLAQQMPALPKGGWRMLGIVEMVGALFLIVPLAADWMPILTPIAAAVLAVETIGLAIFYGRYSLKIAPTNPLVWSAVMGLLVVLVACGRFMESNIA